MSYGRVLSPGVLRYHGRKICVVSGETEITRKTVCAIPRKVYIFLKLNKHRLRTFSLFSNGSFSVLVTFPRRFTKVYLTTLLNQYLFSLSESDLIILNLKRVRSGIFNYFAIAILEKGFKGNALS